MKLELTANLLVLILMTILLYTEGWLMDFWSEMVGLALVWQMNGGDPDLRVHFHSVAEPEPDCNLTGLPERYIIIPGKHASVNLAAHLALAYWIL